MYTAQPLYRTVTPLPSQLRPKASLLEDQTFSLGKQEEDFLFTWHMDTKALGAYSLASV